MAGRTKAAGIVWNISVNEAGASSQISLLKQNVRELNREWRNQYKALMAAGRYQDALKEKERGLSRVSKELSSNVNKVNTMLDNSKADSGTRKYKKAQVALAGFNTQAKHAASSLNNVHRQMILHNQSMRDANEVERGHRQIGNELVRQYRAEGNETKSNAQKAQNYKERLKDLNNQEKALLNTKREAHANGLDSYANPDYTRIISQLHRVEIAEIKVRDAQKDFSSHLTQDTQFNEYYNQSTNKLVASLRDMQRSTEANRVEYNRLLNNQKSESRVLDLETQKAHNIAKVSGYDSVAFQKENSYLTSLRSTYQKHANTINVLGNTYSRMSSRVAASVDEQRLKIRSLNLASHQELQTAHSLTTVSLGLGQAFVYGAQKSMTLENEFNRVRNLLMTSNESYSQATNEIHRMSKATEQYSIQYGISQNQISKGYEALVRRGYNGKQALASQKYYMQGAIASGDKYSDVMHTAASALESFNMRSNNTGRMVRNTKTVVNQLAYSADLTATDMKGIGYGMQYVGDTAHNAHQSLSETASALGELSNRGENSTVAATGLRKILLALSTIKTSKNNKVLTKLGLQPKDLMDAKGNLKSLQDVFSIFNDKMRGMSRTEQASIFKSLFGTTGINSAFALKNSTTQLKSLNAQVAKSQDQAKGAGYTARISRNNMNSTQMQMKRLQMAGEDLAKSYAQGLNPAFKRLAKAGLAVSKVVAGLPKPFKNLAAVGVTVIPIMAGISYGMSAINKVRATANSLELRMIGIRRNDQDSLKGQINSIKQSDQAQQHHNFTYSEALKLQQQKKQLDQEDISSTNNDTDAKNNNTDANDTNTGSIKNNTEADDQNSASELENAKSTENETLLDHAKNLGTKFNGVTGGSIGTDYAGTALKNYGKAGIGMGVLVGGTEALDGDPKGGAEDAIGTAGGTALGGVAAGPIGAAIGGTAGPMIARSVGSGISKVNKSIQSSSWHRQSDKRQHAIEQQIIRDQDRQRQSQTSLGRAMNGMTRSSQHFVKSETGLQSKAEKDYIAHDNRLSKSARAYYAQMYKVAQGYEKKRLAQRDSELKALRKSHLISQKTYNKDLRDQRNQSHRYLSTFKKDENAILKDDTKNRAKRAKAIRALNNQILKMTDKGTRKDNALIKDLNARTTKLTRKTYASVLNQARKNYRDTTRNARRTYNTKKNEADREYSLDRKRARDTLNVHSRAYNRAMELARNHRNRMIRNASLQESQTYAHARNQRMKVDEDASRQASSATKSAYEEEHSTTGIFASMAHSVTNLLSGLAHWHGSSGFHRRASGTLDTQALHFAGGLLPGLSRNENSIINDGGGRELIKLPNGELVLPSGRNVHTVLPKGTSVFNANQTRKLLSAISTLNAPIRHRAGGTNDTNVGGFAGMSFGMSHGLHVGSLQGTVKDTKKSMNDIHDLVDDGYKRTSDDAQKHLQDIHDNSDSIWDDTRKLTKKHVKRVHDDTSKTTKSLRDIVDNYEKETESWSNSHLNTTVRYFRRHFNMIPPITRTSMRQGVSNINSGISAIDRVLSQFGGNSRVLGMVHYATGTSGPSLNKQLAVLNDATSGPQQEAIVSDKGHVRMPIGRNVVTALNPGDKVLNGSDTLRAIKTGLIPHYANGLKSTDALRKLADYYSKKPSAFTNGTFNRFVYLLGTLLSRDMTNSSKNGAQKPANNWSNAMWKYIDSLISGSNSKFLSYAEHTFSGIPYKYGAESMRSADCSGMIDMAARHFNIDLPHQTDAIAASPQVQYMGKSDPKPGYLAIFGHGGTTGHIGIALGNGSPMMFDETPPKAAITPIDCGDALDGYYKLRGLPNDDENEVAHNPLTPLVKRQLGHRASNWIYQNLGDAGMGNPSGTGVKRWRPAVIRALQKNGFPASSSQVDSWLQVINRETGGTGNPGLTNHWDSNAAAGHPSEGLVQTIGPTFNANKFPGHNDIFNGYDDLLAGIHYAASRYGRGPGMFSRVATTGYSNGGLSLSNKIAHISEGNNPEMVLPLTNKSRAIQLMLESMQYMFGNNQNNSKNDNRSAKQSASDRQFERELIRSNKQKDFEINKLTHTTNNILTKMTILIRTIQNKPVLSTAQIYKANRTESMKRARLRNFNHGTF